MKKSRIAQLILLIVVFVVAVAFYVANSGPAPIEDNSTYIPPSP